MEIYTKQHEENPTASGSRPGHKQSYRNSNSAAPRHNPGNYVSIDQIFFGIAQDTFYKYFLSTQRAQYFFFPKF